MARRIIGQCCKSDFFDLTHIGELLEEGQEIDMNNLTKREKVAVRVIHHFRQQNIPLKALAGIKEILLWDMGNGKVAFEYKLTNQGGLETLELLKGKASG